MIDNYSPVILVIQPLISWKWLNHHCLEITGFYWIQVWQAWEMFFFVWYWCLFQNLWSFTIVWTWRKNLEYFKHFQSFLTLKIFWLNIFRLYNFIDFEKFFDFENFSSFKIFRLSNFFDWEKFLTEFFLL